jgi:hypothetical protein
MHLRNGQSFVDLSSGLRHLTEKQSMCGTIEAHNFHQIHYGRVWLSWCKGVPSHFIGNFAAMHWMYPQNVDIGPIRSGFKSYPTY